MKTTAIFVTTRGRRKPGHININIEDNILNLLPQLLENTRKSDLNPATDCYSFSAINDVVEYNTCCRKNKQTNKQNAGLPLHRHNMMFLKWDKDYYMNYCVFFGGLL